MSLPTNESWLKRAFASNALCLCLALLGLGILLTPVESLAANEVVQGQGAIAPFISLSPQQAFSFGTLSISPANSAGFVGINATTGAETLSNVVQIGFSTRGSFLISGRSGQSILLTLSPPTLACDAGWTCTGTPVVSNLAHSFSGQISTTSCLGVKCTELVYIGGRLDFSGNEFGRFVGDLVVTAQYQ